MSNLADPVRKAAVITPSDTVDLPHSTKGIWVGGAGNLRVAMGDGTILTFTGVLAGTIMPLRVKRVYATSTTATNMVAMY